jgi:3-isopropylmalate/(R)-2-methylmalate dehydratase large subunit
MKSIHELQGFTVAEKILSNSLKRSVHAGEIVFPVSDWMTVHDWYTVNFADALDEMGVKTLFAPDKVIVSTDHEPVASNILAAQRQRKVRSIATRFNVSHFYDVGIGGHGHVFPVEMGLVKPGMLVIGYDTHVTNFGAIGALGFAIVTEIPELLACGSVWLQVPETVRVDVIGKLSKGVFIRDAIQAFIASTAPDLIDAAVVEFGGSGIATLSQDARYTLVNIPTEIGARSALIEPDSVTDEYLKQVKSNNALFFTADGTATYRARLVLDLNNTEPQVACPPRPENVHPVSHVAGTHIDHAYIGSCANGQFEDLQAAAKVLAGRRVAPHVRLFVTPATVSVQERAARAGVLDILREAGAILTTPGCGVCASGRVGAVASDEVSIGTGTRNDPGRIGANQARLYLASPATVAASACAGKIADPRTYF